MTRSTCILLTLLLFVLCAIPALAGGGPLDRPESWKGDIPASIDRDSVSYNEGVLVANTQGTRQVVVLIEEDGYYVVSYTGVYGVTCQHPLWHDGGVYGYDASGRLVYYKNGSSRLISRWRFGTPVRPAVFGEKIAYGGMTNGQSVIIVANQMGKPCEEKIQLGKATLKSLIFIGGRLLYVANQSVYIAEATKVGYVLRCLIGDIKATGPICYAADRLYVAEKDWGLSSWNIVPYVLPMSLYRDSYVRKGGVNIPLGGDGLNAIIFTEYGIEEYGVPYDIPGKG